MIHKNYLFSIGKGSEHINSRCLFLVDNIQNKEVNIICFPTEVMVADFIAKPTQGSVFAYHRNVAQGMTKEDFHAYKKESRSIKEV